MKQRKTVGKLSSNFPLNVPFNHNAEYACHKERKIPLLSTGMHVVVVVCHYSEPQDRFSSWEADSALQVLNRLSKIQMQLISLITTWKRVCVQEEMVALRTVTGILQQVQYAGTKPAPHRQQREGNFSTLSKQKCFLWKQTARHEQDNSLNISHLWEKTQTPRYK